MGKNKHNKHSSDKRNGQNVRISDGAREFAKLDLKKFKKKEGEYYDSKKELKRAYYSRLVDLLPEAIEFVVFDGYKEKTNDEVAEIKNGVFCKIGGDDKFVEYVTKCIKNEEEIENIKLMPVMLSEILKKTTEQNERLRANDPNAQIYDLTDVLELSKLITKKKRKKLLADGVDENLAFDLLSVIPDKKIMKRSSSYRFRCMLDILNKYASSATINVDTIIKHFIPKDYIAPLIVFLLLERRAKNANLTDPQRVLYNNFTEWCFKTLEEADKADIYGVLMRYIKGRKEDQRDSDRRYDFTLISENEYPKIAKIVKKIIDTEKDAEKYLK